MYVGSSTIIINAINNLQWSVCTHNETVQFGLYFNVIADKHFQQGIFVTKAMFKGTTCIYMLGIH